MTKTLALGVLTYWETDPETFEKEPTELTILMTPELRAAMTGVGYRQFYSFVAEEGGEKIIPSADIIRIDDEPI